MTDIDPRGILMIFLPVLIFENAFNTDFNTFRRQFFQIIILSYPAVIVSAILTTLGIKLILWQGVDFSWTVAFLLSVILVNIDFTAIRNILSGLGMPKKFMTLIENESLINSGATMILIQTGIKLLKDEI